MLVIHGAWVNGLLGVWAEDTARGAVRASRGTLPSHPFAASPAALARALGVPATGPRSPAEAREGELTVLLPGSSVGPLPSPESGPVRRVRRPKISAWRVPALLLRPPRALSLLGSLTDPDVGSGLPGMTMADPEDPAETGEPAWRPGLSLRYLAVLAEHAWSLVRRGRVLPGLVTEEGTPAARWRPVIAGADRTAFHDLATAMPPVCRATPEERPAAEVLAETLSGLVDGAARLSLPDRLLLGHRPGLRAPLPDRWLYALTGEDATLPAARPAEAKALGEALDGWFAAAHELDGPVRACFRLIEPSREGGPWKMEFGLVSTPVFRPAARKADAAADGEPSGYLSAEHIRAGRTADWLPDRPMEVLRAELARAARLHPDLRGGLRDPEPTGLTVETAWAFSFLRHGAPALRAAGYGVLSPCCCRSVRAAKPGRHC